MLQVMDQWVFFGNYESKSKWIDLRNKDKTISEG
jgi:hypothetical protein